MPACRLHFILARSAPVGVIFRRGPSEWVQLIKWRTDTDTFESGQWFHGRVYEDQSDLSPSGEHLIYFARKMGRRQQETEAGEVWTAISRPPYFTALALWPNFTGWHGGGLFDTESRVWVHVPGSSLLAGSVLPGSVEIFTDWPREWPDIWPDIMSPEEYRLSRKCWESAHPETLNLTNDQRSSRYTRCLARASDKHVLTRATGYDAGGAWTYYELSNTTDAARLPIPNATCADWDHAGRLVYAAEGKLFEGHISHDRVIGRDLADFNSHKFQPIEAPEWAKQW